MKPTAKLFKSLAAAALLPFLIAAVFFSIRYYVLTIPVTIIYTNDFHGHILPDKNGEGIGGAAAIAAFVKSVRRKDPDALFLDAGDFFQGTPQSDLSKGRNTILVMNRLGYDAAAVGNHEFDFGLKNLGSLAAEAQFPFLSANIFYSQTNSAPPFIKPYIIKEVKGVRIAIFGLTSERTPEMSIPENVKGLRFEDARDISRHLVGELRKKADVIVALSHLGLEKSENLKSGKEAAWHGDIALASEVPDIDIIIGGHTHTHEPGLKVGKTFIVQTAGLGRSVGKLTIRLSRKSGKPLLISNSIVKMSAKKTGEDPVMKDFVGSISSEITGQLATVIGEVTEDIKRSDGKQSPLGFFIADIIRQKSGAMISFNNRGGVRADFKKGHVTLGDVYMVSPFDNTIVTMKLSGAQIRAIVGKSIANTSSNGAAVLDASGLRLTARQRQPSDEKADIDVSTKNKNGRQVFVPLDDKKYYTVATNSFLASGGDGFVEFTKGTDIRDTGINIRAAIADFIKNAKKIKPPSVGQNG